MSSFAGGNVEFENYWYRWGNNWYQGQRAVQGSTFWFGDGANFGTGANYLNFNGSSYENVASNERFKIGQLDYFNGSVRTGTAATEVNFSVDLNFAGAPSGFTYDFDLLSTPNTGNNLENADYVWFNNTQSDQTISLYGTEYTLNLEFGETTSHGFSSLDQFHVEENRFSTANLYATLVEVGSWW